MKKEINLEEIFDKMCEEVPWSFIGKEQIKPYILEAIKLGCFKCLDLAAENAEAYYPQEPINMDSILQIKDWIK